MSAAQHMKEIMVLAFDPQTGLDAYIPISKLKQYIEGGESAVLVETSPGCVEPVSLDQWRRDIAERLDAAEGELQENLDLARRKIDSLFDRIEKALAGPKKPATLRYGGSDDAA